ncbi:hypothetical protein [Paenibacillus sp. MBLB4367]
MAKPKSHAEQLQIKGVSTSELAAIVGKTPQWIRQLKWDKALNLSGE